MQSQKQQDDLGSFPSKQSNITVIQVYPPITDTEEAEVGQFYEDLQDFLEQTPKKMSISSKGNRMKKQEFKRYLE